MKLKETLLQRQKAWISMLKNNPPKLSADARRIADLERALLWAVWRLTTLPIRELLPPVDQVKLRAARKLLEPFHLSDAELPSSNNK